MNPVVTVTLDDPRPLQVSVLGEVAKPGSFVLEQNAGVLQAIAAAGGMTAVRQQGLDHGHPAAVRKAAHPSASASPMTRSRS